MSTDTTTLRFIPMRDSARARTDEDAAMAHRKYGEFETLDEAKAALITAVLKEVAWLRDRMYASAQGDARAAEIEAAIPAMVLMSPATDKTWSNALVNAAGLQWSIVRIEKKP